MTLVEALQQAVEGHSIRRQGWSDSLKLSGMGALVNDEQLPARICSKRLGFLAEPQVTLADLAAEDWEIVVKHDWRR